MKIKRYPEDVLGKDFECKECGAIFSLDKKDFTDHYAVNTETHKPAVFCPCCGSPTELEDVKLASERIFDSIESSLRGVAEDIKIMDDSQLRAELAAQLDEIYNLVLDCKEGKEWLK